MLSVNKISAAVALGVLLSLGVVSARQTKATGKLEVEFRNLSEKAHYNLADTVVLDIQIVNAGTEPIGVFARLGMGYQGGIILHVLDAGGAEVQPTVLQHDFLDFAAVEDAKNYFKLQPKSFLGSRQKFAVSGLVAGPGQYSLFVEYHCPVDPKYAKVENFWSIERKSVVSQKMLLSVE